MGEPKKTKVIRIGPTSDDSSLRLFSTGVDDTRTVDRVTLQKNQPTKALKLGVSKRLKESLPPSTTTLLRKKALLSRKIVLKEGAIGDRLNNSIELSDDDDEVTSSAL